MCRWMAWGLSICSSMISRAILVWVRILQMWSRLTWRRLFQSGSCILHCLAINLLPLVEAWWWAVATSDHQRLRSWAENPAPRIPVVTVGESDSLVQLVGSIPQQAGARSLYCSQFGGVVVFCVVYYFFAIVPEVSIALVMH